MCVNTRCTACLFSIRVERGSPLAAAVSLESSLSSDISLWVDSSLWPDSSLWLGRAYNLGREELSTPRKTVGRSKAFYGLRGPKL